MYCTFLNADGMNYCEICEKDKDIGGAAAPKRVDPEGDLIMVRMNATIGKDNFDREMRRFQEAQGHAGAPAAAPEAAEFDGGGGASDLHPVGPPIPEGKQCSICRDKLHTHICIPCGHKCLCESCVERMRGRPCCICNARVDGIYPVHD